MSIPEMDDLKGDAGQPGKTLQFPGEADDPREIPPFPDADSRDQEQPWPERLDDDTLLFRSSHADGTMAVMQRAEEYNRIDRLNAERITDDIIEAVILFLIEKREMAASGEKERDFRTFLIVTKPALLSELEANSFAVKALNEIGHTDAESILNIMHKNRRDDAFFRLKTRETRKGIRAILPFIGRSKDDKGKRAKMESKHKQTIEVIKTNFSEISEAIKSLNLNPKYSKL